MFLYFIWNVYVNQAQSSIKKIVNYYFNNRTKECIIKHSYKYLSDYMSKTVFTFRGIDGTIVPVQPFDPVTVCQLN
jgi:hypothetical protein